MTYRLIIVGLLASLGAGCVPVGPVRDRPVEERSLPIRAPVGHVEPVHATSDPSTLNELLEIATQHHPDVRAARARAEVARGNMIQAGLYPNPLFGPDFGQLGDSANRLGEAGARLTHTIVTNGKLRIARDAGARGVEAADWQAVTRWFDVVTRVRFAYYELLTAVRERQTLNDIVGFSEKSLQDAQTIEKNGGGNRPDVLRAAVELEQNRLKHEVANQRVESARQNLLSALGRPAIAFDRLILGGKEIEQPPPEFDWAEMLTCLREGSSELQAARAAIAQQEKLVAKAKADVCPNVTVYAIPFYESAAREMRGQVIVQAPIPIFDRNQGNIHAAKNELAFSLAFERQTELRLTERLTLAFQLYQSARKQAVSYATLIIPKAAESLKLVEAGYAAGDKKYDYTAVLQAQQVLAQARLAQTQALGDLWRSVIEIAGILQQDDLQRGCAVHERRSPFAQLGSPIEP